jgi:hypothetical protein
MGDNDPVDPKLLNELKKLVVQGKAAQKAAQDAIKSIDASDKAMQSLEKLAE